MDSRSLVKTENGIAEQGLLSSLVGINVHRPLWTALRRSGLLAYGVHAIQWPTHSTVLLYNTLCVPTNASAMDSEQRLEHWRIDGNQSVLSEINNNTLWITSRIRI